MKPDVFVEEIRKARRDAFKKCGYDLQCFYKKIKKDSRKLKVKMRAKKK